MVQVVICEISSLPEAYKALDTLTREGLEALEFYPHAQGVRLLFQKPKEHTMSLPAFAETLLVSEKVLKALLSQTGCALKKQLVVVETKKLSDLLKLSMEFETAAAEILEIRSLRSNIEKNYGIYTLDQAEKCPASVKKFSYTIFESSNPKLKEFLGFN